MRDLNRTELVESLFEYARKNYLSDTALAAKIGLSMFTIWRWRNKKNTPQSDIILKKIRDILAKTDDKK